MRSRTAGVLIGILAVVCFGLILSVVFPFTTSGPHASNHPSERFAVSETGAYSANGSIVADGQVRLAFNGVVTDDGAWYQRVVEGDVVSETYQPATDGTVYRRLTIEGSSDAEQRREQITEDEDRVLVRENQDGDRVTLVFEENTTDVTHPVSERHRCSSTVYSSPDTKPKRPVRRQ